MQVIFHLETYLIFYSYLTYFLSYYVNSCVETFPIMLLNTYKLLPRGLRRRSRAARLLKLWVRIPPGTWMFVCCKCCVLSGRGLCDGLMTHPEESYRMWRVVVCDQETSKKRRLKPASGLWEYNHRVVTPRKLIKLQVLGKSVQARTYFSSGCKGN